MNKQYKFLMKHFAKPWISNPSKDFWDVQAKTSRLDKMEASNSVKRLSDPHAKTIFTYNA